MKYLKAFGFKNVITLILILGTQIMGMKAGETALKIFSNGWL
jgi:hypothetical protein